MGPYCNFCNHRCFAYLDLEGMPEKVQATYQQRTYATIIATCPDGQAYEKEVIGYCYDDLRLFSGLLDFFEATGVWAASLAT